MSSFVTHTKDIYERIRHAPAKTWAYLQIPDEHIDRACPMGIFEPQKHYFRMVVNEMFLADSRQWITNFDPVVFAAVEFLYDKTMSEEPKVVGPRLLANYKQAVPQGVRFLNTPISGLHPYVGGDFTYTVILYRVARNNHVRDLLNVLEKVVNAVDPSNAMKAYLNIAGVVVDGLDIILGTNQTTPVVAIRNTVNLAAGNDFKPGYSVLIDAPENSIKKENFWVRDGRLFYGTSLSSSIPYSEKDFVLFSIIQSEARNDVSALQFYPRWEETQLQAAQSNQWEDAKSSFNALYLELLVNPDLTDFQKDTLRQEYRNRMKYLREVALENTKMGAQLRGTLDQPSFGDEIRDLNEFLKRLD